MSQSATIQGSKKGPMKIHVWEKFALRGARWFWRLSFQACAADELRPSLHMHGPRSVMWDYSSSGSDGYYFARSYPNIVGEKTLICERMSPP